MRCTEVPENGRNNGMGGAAASYHKVPEDDRNGARRGYRSLQGNGRNEGREGATVTCREVPENGRNVEVYMRGCREQPQGTIH